MVYSDLPQNPWSQQRNLPIASVADRFLAFVLDLAIFTPLFGFILAQVFRQVTLTYFVSPQSMEFFVLLVVAILFVAILTILFQTIFLVFWGATPGKYFLKMKVVSLSQPQKSLSFNQAFLRSSLWMGEFFLAALPWLEILSEPSRRPLHDRAAGTMVVTKKQQGDPGPHPLESQFVRQILVVCSLLAMTWVVFGIGDFYQQALRGEFKRAELESEDYLCSFVTNSLEPGDQRIDKALALYLAGEISESCLASEADFVLWTPGDGEKSWAYLAKGVLNKTDAEKYEAYLQRSCDADPEGTACQISKYQASPKDQLLPSETQTSAVLQVFQDYESAKYETAEKAFVSLSRLKGYESFSQRGIVKSLWAQNKIERSKGAYLGTVHQMVPSARLEISAWLCHEELDRRCSQEAIEACEDLKKSVKVSQIPIQDSYTALALLREKECRQTAETDGDSLYQKLTDKKDLVKFVQAISRNSILNPSQRQQVLKDLGFRKESVQPKYLRALAIQAWVQNEKSESQLETVIQFLKQKKVRDLGWIKIYQKTLQSLIQIKSEKLLREIAHLPSREMIQNYGWGETQVRAHYLAKSFEKAKEELRFLKKSANLSEESLRMPASKGGLSMAEIESILNRSNEDRQSQIPKWEAPVRTEP